MAIGSVNVNGFPNLKAGENITLEQVGSDLVINAVGAGGSIKLESLTIKTAPTKTAYLAGESFDPSGMVVEAAYGYGLKENITNFTVSPSGALPAGTSSVTISYSSGGSTKTATQAISVTKRKVTIPTQSGTLTYTGSAQVPAWTNPDSAYITKTEEAKTDAGTYSTVFTLKDTDLYQWSDNTVNAKTINWTINKAPVTLPAQSGTLTYTGSELTVSWNSNYNSNKMTTAGTHKGTNAGTYSATFTPKANYQWADTNNQATRTVDWSIGKIAGGFNVSPTSVTLQTGTTSATATVSSKLGDGAITVSSSDTTVATASISGNTITISAVQSGGMYKSGSATITVHVAEGTNHQSPTDKTISVTASFVSRTLNDNSWSTIKSVSDAGQGSTYWSVGDTKTIVINGTIGSLSVSNLSVQAFILGFNHNSAKEGANRIHFKIGKISGKMIGLCDAHYNNWGTTAGDFIMNGGTAGSNVGSSSSYTNSGGWNQCNMRVNLLSQNPTSPKSGSFMAALPADLRAVMKSCTKYTDNTGNSSNVAANVTATTDYLWLESEFEVQGARSYANENEKNSQLQYSYYANGNAKIHYKHSDTNTAVAAWLRSPCYSNATRFCGVYSSGDADRYYSSYSYAVAPGFCA